ncbi:MAG TPA: hypothetical protein VGC40_07795, partial [Paenirhodobacter sp.]
QPPNQPATSLRLVGEGASTNTQHTTQPQFIKKITEKHENARKPLIPLGIARFPKPVVIGATARYSLNRAVKSHSSRRNHPNLVRPNRIRASRCAPLHMIPNPFSHRCMCAALRSWLTGIAVVTLLVASTAMAGFAHRAPSVQEQQILAAALSGLDIVDICAGTEGNLHFGNHCPACHMGDGAVIPPRLHITMDAELRFVAKVVAPRENKSVRMVLDPAHGLRAPPVNV